MARYHKDDPRAGGYYALWAKAWLDDENLKNISKELKCCFSEIMACAQLIDFVTGRLERGGFILSEQAICDRAGITIVQLKALQTHKFIGKDSIGCVFIQNWHKWQNPDARKNQNNPDFKPIKSELNPDLNGSPQASSIIHQTSFSPTQGGDKSPLQGKGNFNGSGLTEDQFKRKFKTTYERLKASELKK
jgi:hypothetical protein